MNNYFELKININPEIEDIVSDICFSNFECEGVVLAEEAYKDLEMTSTTRGTLRVFITEITNNPVEILKTERELLKERGFSDEELGSWEITLDEKENQDWSKKWKEKWTVTHVTDRVTIVPSWIEYSPKENEITINIDPGCAFGTGTHQTTQLCMVGLEKYQSCRYRNRLRHPCNLCDEARSVISFRMRQRRNSNRCLQRKRRNKQC